ncbi:MAG: hypothetical protein QF898_20915 [SAR202 cluster bacterium]|nr:hypothetical protein [SAR202 cluster bacterium]
MARANGKNDDDGLEGAAFRELRLLEEVDATADRTLMLAVARSAPRAEEHQ